MIKTGLKSFFCSFVLSLLVFFGINKACLVEPEITPSLIPKNNISLFLKDKTKNQHPKFQKISLTKPLEKISDISSEDVEDIPPQKIFDFDTDDLPEPQKSSIESKNDAKFSAPSSKKNSVFINKKEQNPPQVKVLRVSENADNSTGTIKADNTYSISKSHKQISADLLSSAPKSTPEFFAAADMVPLAKESLPQTAQQPDTLLIPLEKSRALPQFAAQKVQINPETPSSQIAMSGANKPITAVVQETRTSQQVTLAPPQNGWQTMAQKNNEEAKPRISKEMYETSKVDTLPENENNFAKKDEKTDSPWIEVGSAAFPKNSEVIKQKFYSNEKDIQADDSFKLSEILSKESQPESNSGNEVKIAGEVLDNIIIPIPQDILDNKDLMPNLVSDPKNKKLEDELLAKEKGEKQIEADDIPFIAEEKKQSTANKKTNNEEKSIFKSIASFFSSDDKNDDASVNNDFYSSEKQENLHSGELPSNPDTRIKTKRKILPSEIRLAFQPEKAEISGKTLDWIRAFGQKALEDDEVVLEIRIDGSSSINLQQKRLNLLYNILTNLGLGYDKVNTVFTSRTPNTFILRVVKASEDSDKKRSDPASFYYRTW